MHWTPAGPGDLMLQKDKAWWGDPWPWWAAGSCPHPPSGAAVPI